MKNSDDSPSAAWEGMIVQAREAVNSGRAEAAEDLILALMAKSVEQAMTNPDPAQEFRGRADACEEAGDWTEAEAARKEVLALALKNPQPGFATQPHWQLANHYSIRGDIEGAIAHSAAALEAARRADITPLIYMALDRHCRTLLLKNDVAAANAAIEEYFTLVSDEPLTANPRAHALILRAQCKILDGKLDAGEVDLRSAANILEPEKPSALPAGKSLRALWWSISADLCAKRGDKAGAMEAAQREVEMRRAIATTSVTNLNVLAESLARLEHHRRAGGQIKPADEAGEESDEIRKELKLPSLRK